jgi:site-specific DNA recombinase
MTKVQAPPDGPTNETPAVVYAAKSTEDKHDSIPTQIEEATAMAAENGWRVVAVYQDEGFSAYSGNRGAGLKDAKLKASETAAEFGTRAMLIAQAHDRFARGAGDRPGAPQSLGELWHEMRRQNVWLRTVEDDEELRDEAAVAAIGRRAHLDSARKSKAVRKGMARRAARGLANGRPPLGYVNVDGSYVIYEPEAAVVRRIFREYLAGRSQQSIGRQLAREGARTKHGGRWVQGTISKVLANRSYLGEVKLGGEWLPGEHEPLIDVETFERAALLRDASRRSRTGGRRPTGPLLFRKGFLTCGACGESMVPRSNPLPGYYYCYRNKIEGPGACSMPNVKAKDIDGAVLRFFERHWLDVEGTRAQFDASVTAWQDEARGYREAAEVDAQAARERYERVRRDYQDGRLDADDWREQRRDLLAELEAAEAQVETMRRREADVTDEAHRRDAEVEVLRTLAALNEADNVDHVRATLMGTFERFEVRLDDRAALAKHVEHFPNSSDLLLPDQGVKVIAHLRPDVVEQTGLDSWSGEKVTLPAPAKNAYVGLAM